MILILGVIKFLLNVAMEDRDKDLQEKLRNEASGILNWALEGFQEYIRLDGLQPPNKVIHWVDEYKESMDYLAEFFEKYCVIEDDATEDRAKIFDKFFTWQKEELKENKPYNQATFNRIMEQHNFKITRKRINGKAGPRMWKGIRLKRMEEVEAEKEAMRQANRTVTDEDFEDF